MPAPSTADADAITAARVVVRELISTHQIPGFSVAVARDGAIVWSETFGLADVEQRVPVTTLTRFRLGSVSKVVTAAGLARLVEEGRLDLDAPIQRYVPGFPKKQWPITTRQLASHTAGIRHYLNTDFGGVLRGAPHFPTVTSSLAIFQDDALLFEPGTTYGYSTYGWTLISAVIEGASKKEFLAYMQEAVFDPLSLRGMSPDHPDAIVPYRTRFYARDAAGVIVHASHVDNSYKWAGGGFVSTADDLVRFGSAHLQPGFLRQQTLDVVFGPRSTMPDNVSRVGLGWRMGADGQGRRIWHHAGTIEGGRSVLMMWPDSKVVVALLANSLVQFGEPDAQRVGSAFIR